MKRYHLDISNPKNEGDQRSVSERFGLVTPGCCSLVIYQKENGEIHKEQHFFFDAETATQVLQQAVSGALK